MLGLAHVGIRVDLRLHVHVLGVCSHFSSSLPPSLSVASVRSGFDFLLALLVQDSGHKTASSMQIKLPRHAQSPVLHAASWDVMYYIPPPPDCFPCSPFFYEKQATVQDLKV